MFKNQIVTVEDQPQPSEEDEYSKIVLLVEDSYQTLIAEHLEETIKNSLKNSDSSSAIDYLFWIIYSIGLECGFYYKNDYSTETSQSNYIDYAFDKNIIRNYCSLPENYIDSNGLVYSVELHIHGSVLKNKKEFKLIGVKSGNAILISIVSLLTIKNSFSLFLPILTYVPKIQPHVELTNLKKLSFSLKNNFFIPARNFYFIQHPKRHPSLIGIPRETLEYLYKYLHPKDIRKVKKIFNL